MNVWVVRAGKRGEVEQQALDNSVAVVGWRKVPDLATFQTLESLEERCRELYSRSTSSRVKRHAAQLWTFRERICSGDLIVLPLSSRSAIAVGRVTGPYALREDLGAGVRHTRPVEWLRTDVPRTAFDQNLLYSFGAMQTVYCVRRDDAETRILSALKDEASPELAPPAQDDADEQLPDLEQAVCDQLVSFIGETFRGHALAALVDAVLRAQGYLTRVSPPGPDGGVDILAGSGAMGFDPPRLCVQVKATSAPVGVRVYRELRGVVQQFHADQGLLVSWGGFNAKVLAEARSSFFTVRLWDSGDLLAEILQNYDGFSDELKARLPLKCIWVLVPEDRDT